MKAEENPPKLSNRLKTEEKSINEAKQRLRLNKRERFERYTRIFNKVDSDAQDQEVLNRGDNFTLDYIFDNKNLLFHQISEMFWNYEHNPELIDEQFRDIYPLLVNQQLDILPRLFGMIMHRTSWEMRYFLLFNELSYQYEFNRKNNLDNDYFEEVNDREIDKLKHHLSNIIVLEAYADQINDKVVQKFIGIKTKQELFSILNHSVEVFNRQMSTISPIKITGAFVSDFLKKYPVDSFYSALNKAKKDFNEKIKGFGGWIYLATNKSLTKRGIDNEVKIGKTKNIPKRLAQYQFASADGFIYEKHWRVKDRHKAEKFIHRALNNHKIENESGGKEWFSLSVDVGIMRVNELIEEYEKRYGYFEKIPEKKKGFG